MLGLTFWTSTHQSLNWADNYWQCLNIWWMNIWKIHGSTGEWSSSQNSHPFVLATERCNPYNDQSTKGLQGFWSLLAQFHPTWGWAQRTSPHLTSGREGPWIFSAMTRVLKSRGGPPNQITMVVSILSHGAASIWFGDLPLRWFGDSLILGNLHTRCSSTGSYAAAFHPYR